ncbi:hypothetical protein KRR40_17765 [Niabella defluvii]|nr:hypothetical protein KRR40_17765 [Niabella sp. I65]
MVVYIEGNSSESVGEMLMKMYKDENFRQNLIKKMKDTARLPDSNKAIHALTGVLQ